MGPCLGFPRPANAAEDDELPDTVYFKLASWQTYFSQHPRLGFLFLDLRDALQSPHSAPVSQLLQIYAPSPALHLI